MLLKCIDFAAMINAGIGATHVNKLLAGLEILPIHTRTLKIREVEAHDKFMSIAETSCQKAIEEETCRLTLLLFTVIQTSFSNIHLAQVCCTVHPDGSYSFDYTL